MSWLQLENKIVVVTGGASGIGRACCDAFAEVSACVVVADINQAGAEEVAKTLRSSCGGQHLAYLVDVTSKKSVDELFSFKQYLIVHTTHQISEDNCTSFI